MVLVEPQQARPNFWKKIDDPIKIMKSVVVDTSVIVKWVNQDKEENLPQATQILNDVKNNQIELIAPEIARYEVGNALLYSKKLIPSEANISFGTAYSLPITFVAESEDLARETFSLAHKAGITYYDASFLSLAKKYRADLVTENTKHQKSSSGVKVVSLKDY